VENFYTHRLILEEMKHDCGGSYESITVSLIPRKGRLYHVMDVKCIKCEAETKIYFDVTAAFAK